MGLCHFNSSCLQKFSSQTGLDVENLCLDGLQNQHSNQDIIFRVGSCAQTAKAFSTRGLDRSRWLSVANALRKSKTLPRDFSGNDSLGKCQTSSPTKPKKCTEKLTNITRHDRKKIGKSSPSHHKHVITNDDWYQAMQGKKHQDWCLKSIICGCTSPKSQLVFPGLSWRILLIFDHCKSCHSQTGPCAGAAQQIPWSPSDAPLPWIWIAQSVLSNGNESGHWELLVFLWIQTRSRRNTTLEFLDPTGTRIAHHPHRQQSLWRKSHR